MRWVSVMLHCAVLALHGSALPIRCRPLGSRALVARRLGAAGQQQGLDPAPAQRLWTRATSKGISSLQNSRVKAAKALHRRRGRVRSGTVLLEGLRLVADALEAFPGEPSTVFVTEWALGSPEGRRLERLLEKLPLDAVLLVDGEEEEEEEEYGGVMDAISTTETPQGVVGLFPQPQFSMEDLFRPAASASTAPSGVHLLVLDGVSDPGNLGTLLRSAGAAGVSGVALLPHCADVWSPKALRAAMGATLRVPSAEFKSWEEIQDAASSQGVSLAWFAADSGGESAYHEVDWTVPSALVVGSEAAGLSPEVRVAVDMGDMHSVGIPVAPGASQVESLNAAVAGSIVLCEALRQRSNIGKSP